MKFKVGDIIEVTRSYWQPLKGKSAVIINIDGVDIVNQTDKLATEIANLCEIQEIQTPSPQRYIDAIEEQRKKLYLLT